VAWISVDGDPVHVTCARGAVLTKADEKALAGFIRLLRDRRCEHSKAQQRLKDGKWLCRLCNEEVGGMDELTSDRPGAYVISEAGTGIWLIYNCPCGCGVKGQLPLVRGLTTSHNQHTWGWDGNRSAPTLTPSIRRNVECKFHGHLQKGVWSACSDGAQLSPKVYKP
jgi:hypothetical protein